MMGGKRAKANQSDNCGQVAHPAMAHALRRASNTHIWDRGTVHRRG